MTFVLSLLGAAGVAIAYATVFPFIPLLRAVDAIGAVLLVLLLRRVPLMRAVFFAIVAGTIADIVVGDPVGIRAACALAAIVASRIVAPQYARDPRHMDAVRVGGVVVVAGAIASFLTMGPTTSVPWVVLLASVGVNAVVATGIGLAMVPRRSV